MPHCAYKVRSTRPFDWHKFGAVRLCIWAEEVDMKAPFSDSTAARNKVQPFVERRSAIRVLAHFPVTYRDEEDIEASTRTGLSRDLSKMGCNVISPRCPSVGHRITVILDLKDGKPPLNLPGTSVRWSTTHRFGVMFPEMTAEDRKRLQQTIWQRARSRGHRGQASGQPRPG